MEVLKEEEFKALSLDMLIKFSEICESYGLRYILDYGTLLGSIRHQGFIPWDDDIDVTMPREDYDKFCSIISNNPSLLGANYRLSLFNNENSIQKPILNIIDVRTLTCSNNRLEKFFYPVWIDVFPADHFPQDEQDAVKIFKKCEKLMILSQRAVSKGAGKLKFLKSILYKILNLFLPVIFQKLDILSRKYNNLDNDLYRVYFSYYRDILSKSDFNEYIYKEFEGHEFRVPKNYDYRLRLLYGDYMSLPPENQRVPHVVQAYWVDK